MKKKIISALLMVALIVTFVPSKRAHADVLAITEIAAASYAAMSSWGIDFTASNATAAGMQNSMEGAITDYVNAHGGSLTAVFGSDAVRITAGKIAMGQTAYNGLVDFFGWLTSEKGLTGAASDLFEGMFNGTPLGEHQAEVPENHGDTERPAGAGAYFQNWSNFRYPGYGKVVIVNGELTLRELSFDYWRMGGDYTLLYENGAVVIAIPMYDRDDGHLRNPMYTYTISSNAIIDNNLSWNTTQGYAQPIAITTGQQWVGTISGSTANTAEDTVEDIFTDVAQNSLTVTGNIGAEVQPTTAPTNPPATPIPTTAPGQSELDSLNSIISQNDHALQGINDLVGQGENVLDSLNDLLTNQGATAATVDSINDLLGQYEGVLDGINDLIGGENGILDGVSDIGGTMTEALEGINDLLGQGEDVVSSLDDINTGIGSMTEALEGVNESVGALEQSLTDALSIPSAAEATQNANALKFDLKTLFPFCIPFDVYHIVNIFNASPVTPRVQIPFNIPAIGLAYTFNLDLSDFDGVASILRNVELVAFCVGLAIATRKFIRW